MSYLLNYKNWRALHESQRLFESAYESLSLDKLNVGDDYKKEAIDNNEDQYEALLQFFKNNGIIFSVDQETAAAIGTKEGSTFVDGPSVKPIRTLAIKLNPAPGDANKILTTGLFLEDRVQQPDDDSQESEYKNIAKYLNNTSLLALMGETNIGYGYTVKTDTNGSMKITEDKRKTRMYLYGTSSTTAAQSKEEVKTTVWTVPEVGQTIEKKLPGTMFKVGEVTIQDSTELDKAIAELNELAKNKNTKIVSITIESSASGDEGVGGKSGYPSEADVAAKKYPLGKPYLPKSAEESGNAKLAFGRAETIKAKLGDLASITTVKAMIQNGLADARYAKIIAKVEKIDKPAETLTKQELQTILTKPKSTSDLSSTRELKVFEFVYK